MEADFPSWDPLLLLLQAQSKDTLARFMQALWASRKSGLDASQRTHFEEQLRLSSMDELDQVAGCLLKLIQKSLCASLDQTEIQRLFPLDFHPRLQKLLAELLQKFQHDWREEAVSSQVSLPRLRSMTWDTKKLDQTSADQGDTSKVGIVHLKVSDSSASTEKEYDVDFQVSRETLGAVLESLHMIRDQLRSITPQHS